MSHNNGPMEGSTEFWAEPTPPLEATLIACGDLIRHNLDALRAAGINVEPVSTGGEA